MSDKTNSLSYSSSGVSYEIMDPVKKLAQRKAKETSKNLLQFGLSELEASRGESAYIWEDTDCYRAISIEGLGSKNLVADAMRKLTGKTYYEAIAQDTIATFVNDVTVVGANPQVVTAYFGIGDSKWLADEERAKDLVEGWVKACNLAEVTWGGGETPTLKGIINPDTIDLAGSCVGIIKPKSNLAIGSKIREGDRILLIESSGIHANGLTLARTLAEKLPEGFATKLSDGTMYGEVLLAPTHIYSKLIKALQAAGVEIHYMINITGHGWRKLMRAKEEFSYIIEEVPEPQEVFKFIQKESSSSDEEMYGNFNMGAGFALYLSEKDIDKAIEIATENNFKSWNAGYIEKGPKQVVIKPRSITYSAESLGVR